MAIKEERDKYKNREKEYKDNEYEIIEKYEKRIVTYENEKKENDDELRRIRETLERLKREAKEREEELLRNLQDAKDNKDRHLLNYLKGTQILQRAVWRMTHPDPLNAMGEKIDDNYLLDQLRKVIKIKKQYTTNLLRRYFNLWKKNALKGVDSDILYKLLLLF